MLFYGKQLVHNGLRPDDSAEKRTENIQSFDAIQGDERGGVDDDNHCAASIALRTSERSSSSVC
jgi:hypothetical protein